MVGKLQTFQDFLINPPAQIDLPYFVLYLILGAIMAFILGKIYIYYGTSLSNRKKFAENFILVTTTTTLIITVVKSSLALSLGLVGALSIVRFRAAIKEPEELAFLFITISIGLGLGAGQVAVTIVAFVIISLLVFGRHFYRRKEQDFNFYINIKGKLSGDLTLRKISEILKKNCTFVKLKRFDKSAEGILEASFLVEFKSLEQLERTKRELNSLSKSITISYLSKVDIY